MRIARVRHAFIAAMVLALAACASQAERQAEQARRQNLVETQLQLGVGYLQRGQLEFALENFTKALNADPEHVQANNMMALLQWRLKNLDEAERYFRKAVSANPANPEAWNNFGVFLCERGWIDEAVTWFEKAAADALYKTPAEANVNAGVCLMKKPAPVQAEKYFRAALDASPKQAKALLELARIRYDAGQALSARGFVQRYFEAAQDSPESLWLAVRIERALKNKDAEATYALRLKGKFSDSPEAQELKKHGAARGKEK